MTQDDAQQAAKWTHDTGLPLLRPTDNKEELAQLWETWQGLSREDKARSDEKSIELFGMDNTTHHEILELLFF